MVAILLTWELGGGMGHLINLLPLARGLRLRGHRVVAALGDLSRAEQVFEGLGLAFFQAPVKIRPSPHAIEPQRSFAHILHNNSFGDAFELKTMAGAWRNLFLSVRPDLIVFDHSPTALLAACGLAAKKAMIGTGFFCPLDGYPLPDLRPWLHEGKERLRDDENHVLANANQVLAAWGQPPLKRISRLFHEVDEQFLVTLPELDHYQGRKGTLTPGASRKQPEYEALTPCPSPSGRGEQSAQADRLETYPASGPDAQGGTRYWGVWPNVGGKRPEWPEGKGKRVFAYLKPFPALPRLLQQLCDLRCPTIVHGDGADAELRSRFCSASMRFEDQPLDLAEVGRTCDLAVLNGNHGTTVSMLLAGKPTLQVPIFLEQGLFSQAVERIGAAVVARPDRPLEPVAGLMELLGSVRYAEAARQFAARYAGYDPETQINAVVDRAEKLLGSKIPSEKRSPKNQH